MKVKDTNNVARIMFILSSIIMLSAGLFTYGMAVGRYKIFPYHQVKYIQDSLFQVHDEAQMLAKIKPTKHLFKARYEGAGVVAFDKTSAFPGLTLLASFFDDNIEIRLITLDGKIVNRWPIEMFAIWENFDHLPPEERPTTDWNTVLYGAMILPDGSIVFNLKGIVKLDRCGNLSWKVPKKSHHSLRASADGGFWVCGKNYITDKSKHPPIKTPYEEDTILKISYSGSIEKEISILDMLWKNDMLSILFANNRLFDPNPENDVIHLNHIDELTADIAGAFPQFDEGDLAVSLREPNMVLVVDPKTEIIKWYQIGPWIQQHDAEFQPDGRISVFDNVFDGTEDGSLFGGSKIVSVNPANGKTDVLYQGHVDQRIYTSSMGDHQILDNGNILITESNAGRIIEVNADGQIVWEYINRYSDDEVIRVGNAIRYPVDYFIVKNWSCD